MGSCLSNPNDPKLPLNARDPQGEGKSRDIEQKMREMREQDNKARKLLLLGAGESGKSTLFKQARMLYGDGFSDKDRAGFCPIIAKNIVENIQILIEHTEDCIEIQDAAEYLMKMEKYDVAEIDAETGKQVQIVWKNEEIQKTYNRRAQFQMQDSVRYFCDNIERIAQKDYLPTLQDILQSRDVTSSVTEQSFVIKKMKIVMVDVGGQRAYRTKWMHQFSQCHGIVFIVAINEYDQVIREDESTNRLLEAMFLFDAVCNNKDLKDLSIILFLNKRDLFEEKLIKQKVPLTDCFPDYNGEADYDAAVKFIQGKFEERNKNLHREIFSYVTCATDTNQMNQVLDSLTKMLIDEWLKDMNLG